jgi:N-glycosylase/DNA lyase
MNSNLPVLEEIELPDWPFDLDGTLQSGQVFHWTAWQGGFIGTVDEQVLYLAQPEKATLLCSAGLTDLTKDYLGLHHDILEISTTFPSMDNVLKSAIAFNPGLRIISQPKWECLATFITSSLKQVPHIRLISQKLRERFGRRVESASHPAQFAYPSPEVLANAGESALRACGLGYRAAFLHQAAVAVTSGKLNLSEISELTDNEAAARLCTLKGIGEKIASCALLFAWGRHGMFPIDVWIERTLRQLYFPRRRKVTTRQIKEFAWRHFGPCRGYAQQYLFHWARLTKCGALPGPPEAEAPD